jgi:predicted unusual protein kinase regulating ubiquinone biosynthesis (AarF/ABC1/UbiB family)
VRQDLALLDALARPLGAAFPALDPAAVLREVRARVLEELDLEHEAEVQRRFHRALRGSDAFVVPAPVMRLAHEGVMVSEWVDGVPLAQAEDRDAVCALLVAFVLGAGRFGVVHADPNPDDVLVTAGGRLAILDFGATRSVPAGRADRLARAVDAFAARDGPALAAALDDLGWLPAAAAPAALDLARHVVAGLAGAGPAQLDSTAVIGARDRLAERSADVARLLAAGNLPAEDLWPARAGGQLFATIARVGATGDWLDLVRDAAHRGWDAAEGALREAA